MNKKAIALVASLTMFSVCPGFSDNYLDPFAVSLDGSGTATVEDIEEYLVDVDTEDSSTENSSTATNVKGEFPVTGTVQGDRLRMREWPWGPVCGQYNTGDTVTVTGVSGEFYAVTVNGVSGYLHKNYVSIPSAKASRTAPYYPGNTATGGYLSKEVGTTMSDSANLSKTTNSFAATKLSLTQPKANSPLLSSWYSGKESAALANYNGGKLSPNNFISLFGPAARDSMKVTGVPASVTMAQAILETGWGGSSIGDAKNLFGIKGTGPAGSVKVNTKECYSGNWCTIKDNFRKYNTWEQSISDHAALLQTPRYSTALSNYNATKNANQYAYAIQKAGYATDPGYGSKLVNLMSKYNLYQWDV